MHPHGALTDVGFATGIRFTAILALTVCAVLADCRSFTATGEWPLTL